MSSVRYFLRSFTISSRGAEFPNCVITHFYNKKLYEEKKITYRMDTLGVSKPRVVHFLHIRAGAAIEERFWGDRCIVPPLRGRVENKLVRSSCQPRGEPFRGNFGHKGRQGHQVVQNCPCTMHFVLETV